MEYHIHSLLDVISNILEDGIPAITIWLEKAIVSKQFQLLKMIIRTAIYSFLIGRLINLYFFEGKKTMEVSVLRSLITTVFNIIFFMYISSKVLHDDDEHTIKKKEIQTKIEKLKKKT